MKILNKVNSDVQKVKSYQPGRPIEDVARDLGLNPADIVKLASNESVLGVAPSAKIALAENIDEMHRYPDAGAWELRQKLSEKLNVKPEQLIFGAGSNEILVFIAQLFMRKGHSVVASAYAFVIYKILSGMMGADFIEVPTKDFQHDLDAMADAIRPDTAVVFVCNPNNPTGTLVTQAEIEAFMARVPEDVLVVFDEAYAEICLGEMPDTLSFVHKGRACMVLRTFSKAYGLAGLRIGYGIGPEAIIKELEKPRQPFNANLAAQKAALAALDDDQFLEDSVRTYSEARDFCEELCDELDLAYVRAYANFILIKTGHGLEVTSALTAEGVIVRPMAAYGLAEWIRVSFGRRDENEAFAKALRKVLVSS